MWPVPRKVPSENRCGVIARLLRQRFDTTSSSLSYGLPTVFLDPMTG